LKERHLTRKIILSTLISRDLGGVGELSDPDGIKEIPAGVLTEAHKILTALKKEEKRVDHLISLNLRGRRLIFLGSVERAALRLATYELLFSRDTPPKVAISEAIVLTKKFAGEESARFVNGVLRGIYNASRTDSQGQD